MFKKEWKLLSITLITSLTSLILLLLSIVTTHWIDAKAKNTVVLKDSEINYGLFSGSLVSYPFLSGQEYDLTLTCDYSKGACIYSCQNSYDKRQDELNRILKGESLIPCPMANTLYEQKIYKNEVTIPAVSNSTPSTEYIRSGYWASTVSFFIIAIIFSIVSAIFSAINLFFNPIESIFNVFGLYVWNGITIILIFLVLVIWGILYHNFLQFNIAITDTLRSEVTFNSEGLVSLGYSYFLNIIPFLLHIANIAIIFRRQYVLDREIPPPTVTLDKSDPVKLFY